MPDIDKKMRTFQKIVFLQLTLGTRRKQSSQSHQESFDKRPMKTRSMYENDEKLTFFWNFLGKIAPIDT